MPKQFVDAPLITDSETDISFRQKSRSAFTNYASAILLLQDDIYKEIASVRRTIINPSSTLAGCVALSPATAVRNIVQPTAVDATNLVLKAMAAQTAKVLEIQSSVGAVVGSITTGGLIAGLTWNGSTIGPTYGGTGIATYATGDTLYASGVNTLAKLTIGAADALYGAGAAGIPEYKAVTATAAGAMAGITTLGAVGPVTLSAGDFVVANTYGLKNATGYLLNASGTTLQIGGALGDFANNIYSVSGTGAHTFWGNSTTLAAFSSTGLTFSIASTFNSSLKVTGNGDGSTSRLGTWSSAGVAQSLTLGSANQLVGVDAAGTGNEYKAFYALASGKWAAGAAVNASHAGYITGALMTGTDQNGLVVDVTATSAATATIRGGRFKVSPAASVYTTAVINVIEAAVPTISGGAIVTDLRGVVINAMTGATNNVGLFVEAIAGGTINRAIWTGATGDVLLGYLAGTGVRMVTTSATGVLGASTATIPITAAMGDIMYATAANVWGNLAVGALDRMLGVNDAGTLPVYKTFTVTDAGNATVNGTLNVTGIATSTATGGGSAGGLQVVAASPFIGINITGQAANGRQWDIGASTTTLLIRAINDANNTAANAVKITRNLTTITDVSVNNTTDNGTFTTLGTGISTFGGPILPNNTTTADINSTASLIFGTSSSGAAYPYTENGNLILQARTSSGNERDLLFYTASAGTNLIAGRIKRVTGVLQWGKDLIVYSDNAFGTAKFTVTAASGNTDIQGTLGVTGATTLTALAGTGSRMVIASAAGLLSAPALSSAYSITNVTTDRAYNANSTTIDELADVLGTLIADLQAGKLPG